MQQRMDAAKSSFAVKILKQPREEEETR